MSPIDNIKYRDPVSCSVSSAGGYDWDVAILLAGLVFDLLVCRRTDILIPPLQVVVMRSEDFLVPPDKNKPPERPT